MFTKPIKDKMNVGIKIDDSVKHIVECDYVLAFFFNDEGCSTRGDVYGLDHKTGKAEISKNALKGVLTYVINYLFDREMLVWTLDQIERKVDAKIDELSSKEEK